MSSLRIRGARTHNLKNIDVDVPLGKLVALAGRSGSGKSSLAFDTIYAESLRRYVSAVGRLERDRLQTLERPDVDWIEGLGATIALHQDPAPRRSSETVGTFTEIHDALALLFARQGVAHCPQCSREIRPKSAANVVDEVLAQSAGSRVSLLAPIRDSASLGWPLIFDALSKQGFTRVRIGDSIQNLPLPKNFSVSAPSIEVVIDRVVARSEDRARLLDSVELGLRVGAGAILIEAEGAAPRLEVNRSYCWYDNIVFPELSPALFSFRNPLARCPTCQGTGYADSSENRGAFDFLEAKCPTCRGQRLGEFARGVTYEGLSFPAAGELSLSQLKTLFEKWSADPSAHDSSRTILQSAIQHLHLLQEGGLHALQMSRPLSSLSTGEYQRLRMLKLLTVPLPGALYILDEPSLGQHPSDLHYTLRVFDALLRVGSGVLIVEHNSALLEKSAWILELGPGAGREGGSLLSSDSSQRYLAAHAPAPTPTKASTASALQRTITVEPLSEQASALLTPVAVPLAQWTCLSGPSGAGKSLVMRAMFEAAHGDRYRNAIRVGGLDAVASMIEVDAEPLRAGSRSLVVTYVEMFGALRTLFAATPEARARGWTAAYFSLQNKGGRCEACEGSGTSGAGDARVEFSWTDAPAALCEVCAGRRYALDTEQVRYRGWSIADVLLMEVREAARAFESIPALADPLRRLSDVGLDYVLLGQMTNSLSGGEAQRLKFARELAGRGGAPKLFLFDLPSRGLSDLDVPVIINVLRQLVAQGHTVLTADHNPLLIASADCVVELGPRVSQAISPAP